jgi:hypothetical protein
MICIVHPTFRSSGVPSSLCGSGSVRLFVECAVPTRLGGGLLNYCGPLDSSSVGRPIACDNDPDRVVLEKVLSKALRSDNDPGGLLRGAEYGRS